MNQISRRRFGLLLPSLVAACSDRTQAAESAAQTSSAIPSTSAAEAPSSAPSAAPGGGGDGQGGGGGKKRFGDSSAYVDGVPLGVLRYFELPPRLEPFPYPLANGRNAERYRVAEYLVAVGVDLAKVQAVHFVGGRNRTAIVRGEELRKQQKVLAFSFTRETAGKARMHWPPGIDTNTTIDAIVHLLVYVAKAPPSYDPKKKAFFDEKGARFEGVPYSDPAQQIRGTRVYLDGRFAGSVKRKRITDEVLSASYTPANPLYSLEKYLASLGAEPAKAAALVVVQGDSVTLRLDRAGWEKSRKDLDFAISKGSEGRVVVLAPETRRAHPAHSLHLFSSEKLPARMTKAPIEEPGSDGAQDVPNESEE
jgi:hypothetical protein